MSDIKVNCPHCRQPLEVPEEMLGTIAECPSCNGQIQLTSRQSQMRTDASQQQNRSPQPKPPIKPPLIQNGQQPKQTKTMLVIVSALVVLVLCLVAVVVILLNRQAPAQTETAVKTGALPVSSLSPKDVQVPAQNESAVKTGALPESSLSSSVGQAVASKQAGLPGKVEGSAWIIKGGGQSDILRGLTVSMLNVEVDSRAIAVELEALSKYCLEMEKTYAEAISNVTMISNIDMKDVIVEYHECQKSMQQYNSKLASMMNSAININTKQLYALILEIQDKAGAYTGVFYGGPCNAIWLALVDDVAISKGATGIDGKYSIPDVEPKDYIMCAQAASTIYCVEWCLPISVKSGETTKIDLFNDNAAHAGNK